MSVVPVRQAWALVAIPHPIRLVPGLTPIAGTAMCVSQVVLGVEQGRWELGKGAAR